MTVYEGQAFNKMIHVDVVEQMTAGVHMEVTAAMLDEVNKQVTESRHQLQQLNNQVKALTEAILPQLSEQVSQIRSARMAATSEFQVILRDLSEVRKFFLASEHKEEVARLERMVELCRELKRLRDDGTLDAVLNAMLSASIGKEQ